MSDANSNEEPARSAEERSVKITFRIEPPAQCPVAQRETPAGNLWVDVGETRLRCDLATGEETAGVEHYERPRAESCPCVIFREHGAVPHLRAAGDEIICTVYLGSPRTGRELIESLSGQAVEVTDFSGPEAHPDETATVTLDRAALTDKQRQAIELAAERGYYEVPAEATIEDLAAELDLSPSAFGKRLKRAERTVVLQAVSRRC